MPDELDEIIGNAADAKPENDGKLAEEEIKPQALTKEDLAAMLAESNAAVEARFATKIGELATQLTARPAPAADAPSGGGDAQAEFWTDPQGAVRKEMESYVQKTLAPVAGNFANTLTSITIDNFKARKSSDPLFGGVEKVFDEKLGGLNKTWLASLSPDNLAHALAEAWDASVGGYVQAERTRRASKSSKPANLGGGGGAGSADSGKTGAQLLQEADPIAYRWAVQGGMKDEEMAEIAKSPTGESE